MPGLNDISLRQLQYLVAVADTKGFHKAAERCHVSQPTLSAQVQQLEGVLGIRVFERDRRHVLVTSAGAEVIARARRVLVEAEDVLAAAARLKEPFTGTLRIGVLPTIAPYLLPELMPRVREAYPRLTLIFREEKTADLVREIARGALDGGLLARVAEVDGYALAEVALDPFVVALPKGHPLARKRRLQLADLDGEEVLLLEEGHCLRDQALALCAKSGATEMPFRATSLATLAQMVSAGAGITLLPSIAVPVENRRGQLEVRPLERPVPGRMLSLVWRPSSPLGHVFEALAATLGKAAKEGAARSGARRREVG